MTPETKYTKEIFLVCLIFENVASHFIDSSSIYPSLDRTTYYYCHYYILPFMH